MKKAIPEILYEDNHLLIVNKPAGYVVQEDEGESLARWAKDYIIKKYNKPGEAFLGVVHRLDTPVSGAVVLAKTSKALERMNKLFRERDIQKVYWALTDERPPEIEEKLEHYIKKNKQKNKSTAHDTWVRESQRAELQYEVIAHIGDSYLLEIELKTGRPHQIRAQMAAIGCPIIKDKKYGYHKKVQGKGLYLHSRKLNFIHPVKKEKIEIKARLPKYPLWQPYHHLE